jgi:GNAT superfamily N-acetyltransferase
MIDFSIREAGCEDARGIAEVHMGSWLTTYRGIATDEFLDAQSVEASAENWQRNLCREVRRSFVYLAEVEGRIVGFASGGPERENDADFSGELYALYLLQAYQRHGIGSALLRAVSKRLFTGGHKTMLIWVLAQNPAVRFYESCGGVLARRKLIDWGGKALVELGYGWTNLETLSG